MHIKLATPTMHTARERSVLGLEHMKWWWWEVVGLIRSEDPGGSLSVSHFPLATTRRGGTFDKVSVWVIRWYSADG